MTRAVSSCEEVLQRLFAYLDGELDDADSDDIEHHLDACRGCFGRAEFERRLRARLADAMTAEAPETLRRRVRGLIDRL